ncbi:MAG: hypothetical protein CVT48_06825 [Thermoplasmata archaeon HGW-Thermoplasmata-1]|nr:MAG: hypothetical protein CVT47_01965 [Thermoplasmata archaeon HGW-Thermoplasmata-2]PKK85154.1 MAG: hypothetical protein CVT48_06825 [Thermoplasmata archaeon HGW-Thermoplasmata-1]
MLRHILLFAFNTVNVQQTSQGANANRAQQQNRSRQHGKNPQAAPQIPRAKRRAAHRNRYVVFSIERAEGGAPIDRNDLINAMRYGRLYLLRFDGKYGIAQCSHRYKNEAIRFLSSMGWVGMRENRVRVRTFGTSGTVRAACEKWIPEGSSVRKSARRE